MIQQSETKEFAQRVALTDGAVVAENCAAIYRTPSPEGWHAVAEGDWLAWARKIGCGSALFVDMVFRGTVVDFERNPDMTMGNVITDVDSVLVPLEDAEEPIQQFPKVHRGFQQAFRCLWPRLQQWPVMRELLDDSVGKRVRVAGHSLGGALATLCAVQLKLWGAGAVEVFTFGCPRVGDEAFRRLYRRLGLDSRTARFTRLLDPVPSLPPGCPLPGDRYPEIAKLLADALSAIAAPTLGGSFCHPCESCLLDREIAMVHGVCLIATVRKAGVRSVVKEFAQHHSMSNYASSIKDLQASRGPLLRGLATVLRAVTGGSGSGGR